MNNIIQILLVTIVLIAAISLLVKPKLVLPIFVASLPLESLIESDVFSLSKILGLIALLSFFVTVLKEKRKIKIDIPFSIFFLFFIWGTISFFWSVDSAITLSKIFSVFQLLILYFLIINQVNDKQSIKLFFDVFFLGAIVFALFGVSDLLLIISNNEHLRLASISKNANWYFVVSICLIPACYWNFISKKNKSSKILSLIVLLSLFITSIFTQSRGGLISLVVFFLVYFLFTSNKFSWLIIVLLSIILFIQFLPEGYLERFLNISSSVRFTELWPAGLRAFRDEPFLGHGLGTNSKIIPTYLGGISYLNQKYNVHNSLLAIGIELGVPGIILYLLFLFLPSYKLFHILQDKFYKRSTNLTVLMGKIIFCVFIAYLSSWIKGGGMEYQKMLWLLIGLEASLTNSLIAQKKYFVKKISL